MEEGFKRELKRAQVLKRESSGRAFGEWESQKRESLGREFGKRKFGERAQV